MSMANQCNFCLKPGYPIGPGPDHLCPKCARAARVSGSDSSVTIALGDKSFPYMLFLAAGNGQRALPFYLGVVELIAQM